jgi:hypothetical protein
MQITLNLPEDIARHLETGGTGVPRAAGWNPGQAPRRYCEIGG